MTDSLDKQIQELEKQLAAARSAREAQVRDARKIGIARLCVIRDEIQTLTKEAEKLANQCDVVFHFDGAYGNDVLIINKENWTGSNCYSDY